MSLASRNLKPKQSVSPSFAPLFRVWPETNQFSRTSCALEIMTTGCVTLTNLVARTCRAACADVKGEQGKPFSLSSRGHRLARLSRAPFVSIFFRGPNFLPSRSFTVSDRIRRGEYFPGDGLDASNSTSRARMSQRAFATTRFSCLVRPTIYRNGTLRGREKAFLSSAILRDLPH